MPGTAVLTAPLPPATSPLGWCALCAGIVKDRALATPGLTDKITAHERSPAPARDPEIFPLPVDRRLLSPAIAWGIVPQLGAALPLCWAHLPRLSTSATGIIPVTGPLPPPPDGGAVRLDRPH